MFLVERFPLLKFWRIKSGCWIFTSILCEISFLEFTDHIIILFPTVNDVGNVNLNSPLLSTATWCSDVKSESVLISIVVPICPVPWIKSGDEKMNKEEFKIAIAELNRDY